MNLNFILLDLSLSSSQSIESILVLLIEIWFTGTGCQMAWSIIFVTKYIVFLYSLHFDILFVCICFVILHCSDYENYSIKIVSYPWYIIALILIFIYLVHLYSWCNYFICFFICFNERLWISSLHGL